MTFTLRKAYPPTCRARPGVLVVALMTAVVSACTVTDVDPVLPSQDITMLCIDHNPDAGPNYDKEIMDLLATMDIKSRMTGGAFPGECPNRLQTSISWSDSLIPYVVALELSITGESRPLGDASYFVGQGYRTPERFGSAASKAKPLLEKMLGDLKRGKSSQSSRSDG